MLGDDKGAATVQLNFLAPCNICGGHWPQVAKPTGSFAKALAGLGVASEWGHGTAKSPLRTVLVAFCTL